GGAADQQWYREALALHLLGDVHHLIERGRDQTREPDEVGLLAARGLENLLAWHHHAQIDDLEVITLQYHADDVLADVVHVTLDGRDHDAAVGALRAAVLARLDERHQVGDGALHDARALHHLWQEHLARAEQVADHVHAVHQRALDHLQRPLERQARALGV